jgi:hypothetical protein
VTLTLAGTLDRSTFLRATDHVGELVRRPEVAARWNDESSCAGMTVGGLTRHLVGQAISTAAILSGGPPAPRDAETIPVLEHYARAAWVREDLDAEANTSIRDGANAEAAAGLTAVLETFDEARAKLPKLLADPPATAYIPWQGWALSTDDFLVTRLMETVVHSDDLAASVDVPAPDFGPEVLDPVLRLLTALAVRRHGQDAVVRTLTRPQRAPSTISAF